jgi:hypothetical protein
MVCEGDNSELIRPLFIGVQQVCCDWMFEEVPVKINRAGNQCVSPAAASVAQTTFFKLSGGLLDRENGAELLQNRDDNFRSYFVPGSLQATQASITCVYVFRTPFAEHLLRESPRTSKLWQRSSIRRDKDVCLKILPSLQSGRSSV